MRPGGPAFSVVGDRLVRRPLVVALLVGTLALAGCSGGSGRGSGGSGGDAATATTDGAVGTTLPRSVTGGVDLRRLVVSNAPAGYDLLASPPFGAVDLTRLLEQFSDAPTEDRAILEGARFKGGYTRGWLRATPRSFLGVFVFELGDEAGARAARDLFAAQNVAKKNASRFAVHGIADAIGESYTQEVEGEPPERVHLVAFVRGPRLYQVSGQFSDEQAPVDETVAFAKIEDQVAA